MAVSVVLMNIKRDNNRSSTSCWQAVSHKVVQNTHCQV